MDSNIVLSYYEERTRDWRTRYVADIMHIKYAEHKIIKDYDLAIVRQKVDKLIEKWKEMDNKEKNTEFAHNKTLEIKRLNYKIKNILLDGLVQNIDVFQHYKNNAEEELAELDVSIKSTKSAISKLKKPSLPKACVKLENPTRPLQSDFVAKYTIIHKVLPFLKSIADSKKKKEFERAYQLYECNCNDVYKFNLEEENRYEKEFKKYSEELLEYQREKDRLIKNLQEDEKEYSSKKQEIEYKIETFKDNIINGKKEAIEEYCSLLLEYSAYPIEYDKNIILTCNQDLLVIDYSFPSVDTFPSLVEMKFTKGKCVPVQMTEKVFSKHYDDALYQITLRSIYEIFADKYLSELLGVTEEEIRDARTKEGIVEGWEGVHVSGTPDSAYYFSSYHIKDQSPCSDNKKIMILGGGPNRIGQGIEFDYCCVHAAIALKELGFETIIVNCNPETVSTDYDTSDKLYFEPLTLEDVLSIYHKEKPLGVIAQFGGQTPLNLAADLKKYGVNILGTTPETIDMAEDRDLFRAMMDKLQIPMPESGMAVTVEDALEIANKIGYPVMVRPSYVLGGRGMEVVHDDEAMTFYMRAAVGVTPDRPILIDRFLHHATECEADAISDGENVFVPAVMEHIELAGIHSGDSACILPSRNLTKDQVETIRDYTSRIAKEMHVVGLMNMQYAIEDGEVYVLEANPRASRTVPLVSKVCNIKMVKLATDIMTSYLTGRPSPVPALKEKKIPHYGVKMPVFPFKMFPEVDPVLGPEMRSTGEVLGMSTSVGEAIYKAQEATQTRLPSSGTVLLSVNDKDKIELIEVARGFYECGFTLMGTGRTCDVMVAAGLPAEKVCKINEGRPNILDKITNGEVAIIINTPNDKKGRGDDSYIRKAAVKAKIPYFTNMAAAKATVQALRSIKKNGHLEVKSLQEFHSEIQ